MSDLQRSSNEPPTSGTYYACGCFRGGKPSENPQNCTTHDKPWAIKWIVNGDDVVKITNPKPMRGET